VQLKHYTNEILMARYMHLMQKHAKANMSNTELINRTAKEYIKELWTRTGGWNG